MSDETEKAPEKVETPEEAPETKPQETALTPKGMAAMQGFSPENRALLDDLDKLREQQAQELAADLEAFRNRPKPPWVDRSSVAENEAGEASEVEARGFDAPGTPANDAGQLAMQGFVPLSDETRMALYEIQNLPPDQRGVAFSEYIKNAPEQEHIRMNSLVDRYQTKVMDPKTGEWIIVRDDRKPSGE